ncbi:MAG: response regulator transcription factor [Isosphaeraceae bacterium]
MKRCRVLLVDSHSLLLDILARYLAEFPEIDIVARTRDGLEAMTLAILFRPDLVVMNLAMSGLNGLELTRRVAAEPWAPRVILTSFHDEPEYRLAAEAAGADGFVLKQDLGTKLVPLILSLMMS